MLHGGREVQVVRNPAKRTTHILGGQDGSSRQTVMVVKCVLHSPRELLVLVRSHALREDRIAVSTVLGLIPMLSARRPVRRVLGKGRGKAEVSDRRRSSWP